MPSNSILNIKKDGEWIEIPALKGEDGFSPTATVEVEKDLNSEWTKITKVYTPNFDVHKVRLEVRSGSLYISCFQIEEGTQATDYEPYIPSVKMLAEEVSTQNESLADYGLNILSQTYFIGQMGYYSSALFCQ